MYNGVRICRSNWLQQALLHLNPVLLMKLMFYLLTAAMFYQCTSANWNLTAVALRFEGSSSCMHELVLRGVKDGMHVSVYQMMSWSQHTVYKHFHESHTNHSIFINGKQFFIYCFWNRIYQAAQSKEVHYRNTNIFTRFYVYLIQNRLTWKVYAKLKYK